MEAFFLEHEGYFGALGAFLESAFGDKIDEVLLSSGKKVNINDEEQEGEALRFVSNQAIHRRSETISTGSSPSHHGNTSTTGTDTAAGTTNDHPTKKKNWRELFHTNNQDIGNKSNSLPYRRLRTQSLDSHDMSPSTPPLRSPKP